MRPAGGAAGRRGGLEPGAMPADPSSVILLGVLASLGAGLATGVGALPALLLRDISEQVQDVLLGFAAGVLLAARSEEHTSELQSLMSIPYAAFCLKKKQHTQNCRTLQH